ncbi:DUF72 domain-containing protein [Luteibacter flocculans]|uniref:DUF72 domain-containing protein n=1 Tax=Luteibacter flocculans TaxID=2780091 RepID=UPI0031F2FAF5
MQKPRPVASPETAMRVGCAGWSLSSEVAGNFPGEGSHLERYARVFSCVEINSSFYRPHQPKTYRRWAESVPDGFRFSVKMPRTITHERRLQDCDDLVRAFCDEIASLGEKLGCLLVQLPPSLALDHNVAATFFALLRKNATARVACEPRHATWFTPRGNAILADVGVACVQADPAPVAHAACTGDPSLLYLRLHGSPDIYYSAYDDAFIDDIATGLHRAYKAKTDVWCIFDNTARGAAVPNALRMMERLATQSTH